MTKLFFPYEDQPKHFPFKFQDPVRFPFYVNDLVYYWEVDSHGITLYLYNDVASTVKDVVLEETGITIYLKDEVEGVQKHIYVEFAKIGTGSNVLGNTLGELDPYKLGVIDNFTLGTLYEAIRSFADWMNIANSIPTALSSKGFDASNVEMQLESDSVLPYTKNIYIEIDDDIGIVGLNNMHHATLGELDPHLLRDIDAMLSAFRVFEKIPASLVKEIKIEHINILSNNELSPLSQLGTNGSNIGVRLSCVDEIPLLSTLHTSNVTAFNYYLQSTSIATSSADKILQPPVEYVGVENGTAETILTVYEDTE